MLDPRHEMPTEIRMARRLEPIKARVRAAFELMAEATMTVPRMHPALARRLRGPIGRLVAAGQGRDSFDQRIAHLEAASDRIEDAEPATCAAVNHVIAQQLVEISCLLERTSATAVAAFRSLLDAAEGIDGEPLAPDLAGLLAALGHRGHAAATDLAAAVEVLNAEAAGHARRSMRGLAPDTIRALDLDWLVALYTMDEERRVHRAAIELAASSSA